MEIPLVKAEQNGRNFDPCIINVPGDNLLHLFVVQMTQMATYFALVQVIISIVNVSLIRLIFRAVNNLFER